MNTQYVSLRTKAGVALAILLFEAVVIAGFWWAGAIGQGNADDVLAELPPLAALTETSGTVIGFSTTRVRTRSYYAPIVEFTVDGSAHQFGTRSGYNHEAIPFRAGDSVLVLYDAANPASAWLKWEYERYVREATTPRFADAAQAVLTWAALAIVGVTVLLLLLYFVTPIQDNSATDTIPPQAG